MTNCIIHAYEGQVQKIEIFCRREGQKLWVDVIDKGVGIRDVAKAMEPLLQQSRRRIVPGWDLHLWKRLWMR